MGKTKSEKTQGPGPVRFLIDQCSHRDVGGISFPGKTLYPAEWESSHERSLIKLLLLCEDVKTIATQPEKIPYEVEGKSRNYTPDLAIDLIDEVHRYVEVKSLRYLLETKSLDKYIHIASSLRGAGKQLDFITDDQLSEQWVKTAKKLRRHLRLQVPDDITHTILKVVQPSSKSIRDVLAAASPLARLEHIYNLIALGKLCLDWDDPLTRSSAVSLPGQPYKRMSYARVSKHGRFVDLLDEMALGRHPTDKQRLAFARAGDRPSSVPSATGFLAGLEPYELGRLSKLAAKRARESLNPGAKGTNEVAGIQTDGEE